MTLSYPPFSGDNGRPETSSSRSADMNKDGMPCEYPESSYASTGYGYGNDSEKDGSSMYGDPDASTNTSSAPRWSDNMAHGATVAGKTFAKGIGALTAGAVYVAMTPAGLLTTGFIKASESVLDWATSDYRTNENQGQQTKVSWQDIQKERAKEGFEPGFTHVVICGSAGVGKSSIINALRGLKNKDNGAAAIGFVETTTERAMYRAHESFGKLILHDCPGAGTRRSPADTYMKDQKLHLFNMVLIVHDDRFGEIDINTIQSCVGRGQPYAVIRSRSDKTMNSIKDDEEVETDEAKKIYIEKALKVFETEFRQAKLPEKDLKYMTDLYMLVNYKNLRELTVLPRDKWPLQPGEMEIHERQLIQMLKGLVHGVGGL